MHSATADDPALEMSAKVNNLLVLWQDPTDRRFVPIGRFAFDGHTYSFAYTRAAAALSAFRPLPGMPEMGRRYTSERIPALFGQRVMNASRSDFAEYARGIGLDPATATPWEQIVHSGGTRAGDTLQFMQVPTVERRRARARFFVNGVKYVPNSTLNFEGASVMVSEEVHERAIRALTPGARVRLVSEHDNPADRHACLVTSTLAGTDSAAAHTPADNTGLVPLGWVPRILSEDVCAILRDSQVFCSVVRVGPPGSPSHQRIVLDLDHPAPPGFQFDTRGEWQPVVST